MSEARRQEMLRYAEAELRAGRSPFGILFLARKRFSLTDASQMSLDIAYCIDTALRAGSLPPEEPV